MFWYTGELHLKRKTQKYCYWYSYDLEQSFKIHSEYLSTDSEAWYVEGIVSSNHTNNTSSYNLHIVKRLPLTS